MKLLIFVVCLAAATAGRTYAAPSAGSTQPPTEPPACSNDMCKRTAKFISDSLDTSINPCDDFYQFTCGGFEAKRTMPEDKLELSPYDDMYYQMNKDIMKLLTEFKVDSAEGKKASKAVRLAAASFQKCMALGDTTTRSNEEGLKYVKELVEEVAGHGWTIGQKEVAGRKERSWHETVVQGFTKGVIMSPFNIGIGPDSANATANLIYLSPGDLGLFPYELKNLSSPIVTAYKAYIRGNAKHFCSSENCPHLEADIEALVKLEAELAACRMSVDDSRNPELADVRITVKRLSELTHFNWETEMLVPIWKAFGVTDSPAPSQSTFLHLSDVTYFVKSVEVLKRASPRTVDQLLGWRLVSSAGGRASEALRQLQFPFFAVRYGMKKQPPRSDYCIYFVNGQLGTPQLSFALSRLYVDHHFSKAEKAEATVLVNSIQASFKNLLQKNTWLDEPTKAAALKKINNMRKKVGYAESLLDNAHLDGLHALENASFAETLIAEKNYLKSLVQMSVKMTGKQLGQLNGRGLYLDEWLLPPASINAIYFYYDNSITIPAGFLKFPVFSSERSFALNYGGIGSFIGHEITHGFDDTGRKFDSVGNLHNWWSNKTSQQYLDKASCFVQQYSNIVEPSTGLHLNGKLGLGENQADNGGLHVSVEAFKARHLVTPSSRLADLPQYTPEQLFFLIWGTGWCDKTRPEFLKSLIMTDGHSPKRYRTNVPLMNSPAFAEAFKCPLGSKMNPKHKCSIW